MTIRLFTRISSRCSSCQRWIEMTWWYFSNYPNHLTRVRPCIILSWFKSIDPLKSSLKLIYHKSKLIHSTKESLTKSSPGHSIMFWGNFYSQLLELIESLSQVALSQPLMANQRLSTAKWRSLTVTFTHWRTPWFSYRNQSYTLSTRR